MGSMGCQGCGFRAASYGGGSNPDRPAGTAVCGPACTVVWEPRLILTGQSGRPDSTPVLLLSGFFADQLVSLLDVGAHVPLLGIPEPRRS